MSNINITTFLGGTSVAMSISLNSFVRDVCKDALKKHKALHADIRSQKDMTYNNIVAAVNLTKLKLLRRDSNVKRQLDTDSLVWLVHSSEWEVFAEVLNAKDNPTRNGKAIPYKYPSSLASHQLIDFVKDFCIRNSIDESHELILDPRIVTQLSRALTPPPAEKVVATVADSKQATDQRDVLSPAAVETDADHTMNSIDASPLPVAETPLDLTPVKEADAGVEVDADVEVDAGVEADAGLEADAGRDIESFSIATLPYPDVTESYQQKFNSQQQAKQAEEELSSPPPKTPRDVELAYSPHDEIGGSISSTVVTEAEASDEQVVAESFTFDVSDEETDKAVAEGIDSGTDFLCESPVTYVGSSNTLGALTPKAVYRSAMDMEYKNDDKTVAVNDGVQEEGEDPNCWSSAEVHMPVVAVVVEEAGELPCAADVPPVEVDDIGGDAVVGAATISVSRGNSQEDILSAVLKQKEEMDRAVSQLSSLIINLSGQVVRNASPQSRRSSPLRSPHGKVDSSPMSIRNKLRNRILAKKLNEAASTDHTPMSSGADSPASPPYTPEYICPQVVLDMKVESPPRKPEEKIDLISPKRSPVVGHSHSMPITEHGAPKERTLHLGDNSINNMGDRVKNLSGATALMRRRASMGSIPAAKVSISLAGIDSPREDPGGSGNAIQSPDRSPVACVESPSAEDSTQSARWAPFSSPLDTTAVSRRPNLPRLAIEEINSPPPPPPPELSPVAGISLDKVNMGTQTDRDVFLDDLKLLPALGSPILAKKRSPQMQGTSTDTASPGPNTPPRGRRMSLMSDKSEKGSFAFSADTGTSRSRSKSVLISAPGGLDRSPDKDSSVHAALQIKIPPRITPSEEEPNTARDRQIGQVRLPPAALFFSDFFYAADLQHCRQMLSEQRSSTADDSLADEERKRLNAMIIQRINDIENRLLSSRYVWPGTASYQASVKSPISSILAQCDDHLFGENSHVHFSKLPRSGSLTSEKFRRSISKACGAPDSMDDVLVLWSCFQLFGRFDPASDLLIVNALSLPHVLSILQEGGVIPFDECTGKGSFADSVSKRIFYPRYNLAWLSLEFQKTQPSNYAEITKSRKVKRMAETMLLGPRSVLQAESRTSQTAVSRLVPGRLETHSYIDSAEYAAGTVIFDKYKSPAVQKAIQTAKTATKVSFYRFVQFIKNLSNDLIFEADVAAMRKNRDKMKEKAKKPKKEKRMTDHSSHADEPASNSGAREGSVHEKSKTKLSDNLERRYSIGENSLGSAAFDELVEECNNVAELLPEHRSSPAGSTSVSKEHVNTSRSHSFTGSEDETASIDTLSDFASEHFSAVGDVQRKDDDAVKSAAGNMLEFIMLRLRVLISKVDIEHLHFRSSRMSTRNIAAREAVFSDSTVLEATRHLGGGLSIKDITAGILALRGGALDDPEVCYSGVIRSKPFPVSLSLSPAKLWVDWEKNIVQLHQMYAFYAACADKSADMLHGKMLSHGRGGANKKFNLSLDQCRSCLHAFGVLPSFLDSSSFFRLFRAIKRWEWAIGYSYFAGCSPVTLDDSNSSFLLRDSISVPVSTPLHKKNPNTTVNRSSSAKTNQNSIQKRLPFSPCRPPPAPGASPTKKTVVAEAYPNPPCRKTDMLVNPQVDGTQGICAKEFLEEPVIDQLYIHDCASTMGLFHITFGGFIELLCRISILIFGRQGNLTEDGLTADESVRGADIKRCVHNLLRLMDESGGKEALLNQYRKSVVIRKFQF